jgi:hypothetical protein
MVIAQTQAAAVEQGGNARALRVWKQFKTFDRPGLRLSLLARLLVLLRFVFLIIAAGEQLSIELVIGWQQFFN